MSTAKQRPDGLRKLETGQDDNANQKGQSKASCGEKEMQDPIMRSSV